MIRNDRIEYFLLNETTTAEDVSAKHFGILRENVVNSPSGKLFTITFKQVVSECGVLNWNNRVYGMDVMWPAITQNPLVQHELKYGKGNPGEMGHPELNGQANAMARQLTIDPKKACWLLNNYRQEGNLIVAEATTLVGGYGDILRDRALTGVPPMASTRGLGGCDAKGNVMKGFTYVCSDAVFRQSSKQAYADMSSIKVNNFNVPSGNTMTESAVAVDLQSDSFKDFLLTESVSRDKINQVCDTLQLDYDSMVLDESSLRISRIDGNNRTTVVMPLRKLVGASQYYLFD